MFATIGFDARHPPIDIVTVAASDPNIGRVIAERYRIDAVIAKGGMGAVYRGEHVHMRNRVALKLLHADREDLPVLVTRFERESIVGARARHPNVGMATDFGKDKDGSYYLVMEYVDGVTLRSVIDEGPLEPQRALDIALQIARGLEAIHSHEIVHRDLNPRNVMLTHQPRDGVKLIDFGFAQVPLEDFDADEEGLRITSMGEVFGTMGFIAPEAVHGMVAVGKPADLYALGVILYEMLTGQHPFEVKEHKRLFRAHTSEDVPPPSTRSPRLRIPRSLEAVIMRLLEKSPFDRYEDAHETAVALERAAEELDAPPVLETLSDEPSHFTDAPPALPLNANWPVRIVVALVLLAAIALIVKPDWRSRLLGVFRPSDAPTTSATTAAPSPTVTTSVTASATAAPAPSRPTTVDGVDANGWETALEAAVSVNDLTRASQAVFALAEIDPPRFSRPAVRRLAASAAMPIARGDPNSAQRLFAMLTSDTLGTAGPDVLFRLVTHHGGSEGARRAADLLLDPNVQKRASPALQIAMAMRSTPCGSRGDLLERAVKDGDQRVLSMLINMDSDNCIHTCCMRYNSDLDEAIRKLRVRLR